MFIILYIYSNYQYGQYYHIFHSALQCTTWKMYYYFDYSCTLPTQGNNSGLLAMGISKRIPYIAATLVLLVCGILFFAFP